MDKDTSTTSVAVDTWGVLSELRQIPEHLIGHTIPDEGLEERREVEPLKNGTERLGLLEYVSCPLPLQQVCCLA